LRPVPSTTSAMRPFETMYFAVSWPSAQARIGEPHETNRSRNGDGKRSFTGWMPCSKSKPISRQTLSIPKPAYGAGFASASRHGRGDTAYFARDPVIVSMPEL
jgi:hypothetical protein